MKKVRFTKVNDIRIDEDLNVAVLEIEGKEYILKSDSHLWIMPFPREAVSNPGNGTITQNVEK